MSKRPSLYCLIHFYKRQFSKFCFDKYNFKMITM